MIQKGWAIAGTYGLYTGWSLTRRDAIYEHCKAIGITWAQCKKKGDRAVKIEISFI